MIFIIPNIALASWWNPFTWKIFKRRSVPIENIINDSSEKIIIENNAISKEGDIEKLKKELEDLEKQKLKKEIVDLKKEISASKSKSTNAVAVEEKTIEPIIKTSPVVKVEEKDNLLVENKDKYGLTNIDWINYEKVIPSLLEKVDSHYSYILGNKSRIDAINKNIDIVLNGLTSYSFFDSTAIKLGQDYLNTAQQMKLGYTEENVSASRSMDLLNQMVIAIKSRDKDLLDKISAEYKSNDSASKVRIKNNVILAYKTAEAHLLYSKYVLALLK